MPIFSVPWLFIGPNQIQVIIRMHKIYLLAKPIFESFLVASWNYRVNSLRLLDLYGSCACLCCSLWIDVAAFFENFFNIWNFFFQDNEDHNTLRVYWKHLSAVVIGCVSLFVFDVCERGVQLSNPFYSIWVTDLGTNLAVSFLVSKLYFLRFEKIILSLTTNVSWLSSFWLASRRASTFCSSATWFGRFSATSVPREPVCRACRELAVCTMRASSIASNFWCWLLFCALPWLSLVSSLDRWGILLDSWNVIIWGWSVLAGVWRKVEVGRRHRARVHVSVFLWSLRNVEHLHLRPHRPLLSISQAVAPRWLV